jgi:proteasome lid subunit RPN8/RPN11
MPLPAHGRETFPHECCGAMLGKDGEAREASLPNTTEEGPRRRFLVRPDDYRIAEKRARSRTRSWSHTRTRIIRRSRREISITRGRFSPM